MFFKRKKYISTKTGKAILDPKWRGDDFLNVMVIGSTKSGKGRSFIRPLIDTAEDEYGKEKRNTGD